LHLGAQITSQQFDRTYYPQVTPAPRLDLSTFPDSPYAAELQRDSPKMRFGSQLEADYLRTRLLESRTLIRVACAFTALLTLVRLVQQVYEGLWDAALLADSLLVIAGSIALTVLAWSRHFERLYPKWARIVIPLRNSIIAAHIARAAAHGQPEMLMVLPIILIGPFFFLGLPLRTTLVCSAVTVATYIGSATLFGMPHAVSVRSDVFLFGGLTACIIAVWNLERTSRRSFLESNLIAELAQRDALTGTKNRRVFDDHLGRVWQHAIDNGQRVALLLFDVDYFKAYNDHYGHQAGDDTLRRVAQTIQKFVCRPLDIVTRYGGEEFAAILYDVSDKQARDMADRIRDAVAGMAIEHRASRTWSRVTISVGVAAIQPTADRTPRGALQLADQALYEAKVQGRNRVEVMGDSQHSMLVTGVFAVASVRG
jgi:diguanylate cyclase (GGDEF)-like protein